MPTPVSPDIRVRLYQLEENPGGTDLQKKAAPAQVEYQTKTDSPDFMLISLGDITETIEIDKGVYQIDSISLVVDGLAEDFFNAYVDPLNEPYVCEIWDNNDAEVIFHGAIDRDSCYYDPRTQYHSFDILSWTYVLEQTSAASRTIYETKLTKEYEKASGETGITAITIPRYATDGTDMKDVIESGDVTVMETAYGEWRSITFGIQSFTDTELLLVVIGEPETVILQDEAIANTSCARVIYQINASETAVTLQMTLTNPTAWATLNALNQAGADPSTPEVAVSSVLNLAVTFPTGPITYQIKAYAEGGMNVDNLGRTGDYPYFWRLHPDDETIVIGFPATDALITDALANGVTIESAVIPTTIKKGTKCRILGKDVYGYSPTGAFGALKYYEPDEVIEGLFSLDETGIFQYLADTFVYPAGFVDRQWSRFLEWPNNLIKTLRLMQNTEQCFLKITPTLDGSELPRMTITMIDRRDANVATLGAATALTGVIDYRETAADLTPRGVITKPFKEYMIPRGRKPYKVQGHWDKALADDPTMITLDSKATVPPEGGDVVTFTINRIPTWEAGLVWASNSEGIFVPDNFRTHARGLYEFYVNLPRTAEISMDGKVSPLVLGEFVSVNEGGLSRTVFVTSRTYNPITRDTTLAGRVGSYTPSFTEDPVALIDGDLLYMDIGASGSIDVYLSGMRSYHPGGLPLTFLWELDPLGTPSTIGTEAVLEAYSRTPGTYVIGLTVDDGTNTDQKVVTVVVADDAGNAENTITTEANFVSGPSLSVDEVGDVWLTVSGDKPFTADTDSIEVEWSLISSGGGWTTSAASPLNNPQNTPVKIYTGLAEATNLWVQITLTNRETNNDSGNVFVGVINNLTGADTIDLKVTNSIDLDGSFDLDGGALDTFSSNIDGQEFMLVDASGVLFDLDTGDSFDVMNAAGTAFTIDDTGTEVFVLSGDSFRVDVLGTDFLTINESGFQFNVETGDTYTWDINGVLLVTLDASDLILQSIDLDLNGNDIYGVQDLTASGTIAGTINATGGATAGPFTTITSITIVNGIVTAITGS